MTSRYFSNRRPNFVNFKGGYLHKHKKSKCRKKKKRMRKQKGGFIDFLIGNPRLFD